MYLVRGRPFNLHFSFRNVFSDNTRVRIFIIFVAQTAKFFPVFNLRLYDKNWIKLFCFPPPKSEYFFSNIGNQNIFIEKKHSPPLWKLNGPPLMNDTDVERTSVLGFMFTKCFDLQRFVFLIVVKLTEEIMFTHNRRLTRNHSLYKTPYTFWDHSLGKTPGYHTSKLQNSRITNIYRFSST